MIEKRLELRFWARNLEDADKKIQRMGSAYYGNVSYKVTLHVGDAETLKEVTVNGDRDQELTGFSVYAELVND